MQLKLHLALSKGKLVDLYQALSMERVKSVKTKLDVLYILQPPVKIKFSGLRRQSAMATKLKVQANSSDPSVLLQGV